MLCYVWKLITGKVVDGSGIKAKSILLDLTDGVTKINANDFYVRIICDPTIQNDMLEINSDNNILPLINYKVDKDCLYINNSNFALHIQLCDNASLSVHGGCKVTGKALGNSKFKTSRYRDGYEFIGIVFSKEERQWPKQDRWCLESKK